MNQKINLLFIVLFLLAGCSNLPQQTADPVPATATDEPPAPTATAPASLPGILLVYSMEGGIAGFCDHLEIGSDGEARLVTCRESEVATAMLDSDRLGLLLDWARAYQAFEDVQSDDAVADSMTVMLQFNGIGPEPFPEALRQDAIDLAVDVLGQLRSQAAGPTPAPQDGGQPDAILILSPGPGSRLTSPIRLKGVADTTFEQNLGVRLLLSDGTELAVLSTTIQAEMGQGGPFEADIPFSIDGEEPAFLQVFSASPRDGGITHLASVAIRIADGGSQDLRPASSHEESIQIFTPLGGNTLSGGVAHVEGYGLASFEGTLVVDVLDQDGNLIGSMPLIVDAPDIGVPGTFSVYVPYTLAAPGPGRIVVRDPSVAFVGDSHIASVEVYLEP